jgi:uncharacterized protein (DUF2236 family)
MGTPDVDVPAGRLIRAGRGAPTEPGEVPDVVRNALNWFALSAASANVVMQLSLLPVGRGVAESKVDSGRIDKRPLKRGRTTLSYIAVAWHGTDHEREVLREEVNRQHRQVRSVPSSEVKYNAFDRRLQLWVAACLWKGTIDIVEVLYGDVGPRALDDLYRHASRFATTLQVPPELWPADRDAFEEYWRDAVQDLSMDEVTRPYLQNLATLSFLPAPIRWMFGRSSRLFTVGWLPQEFRDLLGLPWTERDQRRFDRTCRHAARFNRIMPPVLRAFPWNLYLRDARRRIHKGRPFV